MKMIATLLSLTLGFAAHAETNNYAFTPQCQLGEIAYADVTTKLDGSFVTHARCIPANCLVSKTGKGVYEVQLMPASTKDVTNSDQGVIVYSQKVIAEIPASNKSQAKAAVQNLIRQGYCHKAFFPSIWDDL